ncbi:GNAT family N-acetyltransferase [Alkalitalea saponilacus]|uniref:Acetyltransferase (GNAT) domain-containing protein n=1 Tax=Alkalitalea saponilacus TaxID=889453 RepID=A0A1T5HR37_9BACT|nr:GNAT family N-acetyltransferase [Alkalitalea saponilacus]ASB48403.1 hemolysin [Alkalitalea saponilacus]SKC23077.1 Acetyltransferase (GNAT) domain-containing protein [Alkalitalea saponilacus]
MDSIKPVIPPVPRHLLEEEMTKEIFVRKTNKGDNRIYDFSAEQAPNLLKEIGRLRELAFRTAGGGTGKEIDLDDYDTSEVPYRQLIVWDPDEKEILGGYRYIMGDQVKTNEKGEVEIATSKMFNFSDEFIKDYLPHTIELGRSFVQPQYQSSKMGAKSLFALDNLWDGLGTLIVNNPHMQYFFGKVTMYTHYNQEAKDLIRAFMGVYFRDKNNLVYPKVPVKTSITDDMVKEIFSCDSYADDYKVLSKKVRELGENIPPLINAYMNLSPSMRTFGTAVNESFGYVEETGIIITIKELYQAKVNRHVESYNPNDTHE